MKRGTSENKWTIIQIDDRKIIDIFDAEAVKRLTAAASRRHADNLDGVRLEKIDSPPGTRLALGFRASLAVVFRAEVTVVTVIRISAPHGRRLVRRFAETDVRTCRNIAVLLQFPRDV
jgi:hypothetical protein